MPVSYTHLYRGLFAVTVEGETSVGGIANAVLQYASGPDLTVNYQWQVGDAADGAFTNLSGEIQPTLVIPAEATNRYIRVRVSVKLSLIHIYF